MYDAPDFAFHAVGHLLLTVTLGAAVMVLIASAAERFCARAAMRRMLWQAVLLGLAGLLVFELTGAGYALSALLTASAQDAVAQADPPMKHAAPSTSTDLEAATSDRPTIVTNADLLQLEAPSGGRDLPPVPDFFGNEYAHTGNEPSAPWMEDDSAPRWTTIPTESIEPTIFKEEAAAPSPIATPSSPTAAKCVSSMGLPNHALWGLALLWSVGLCFFAGRAILGRVRLSRMRRRWKLSDDAELYRLVEDLRGRIGMKRPVRFQVAAGIPAPAALGILRPTVLVPADFRRRFSPSQQQVILAHELAHLAAGDPIWLLAGELIAALFWWHPLVHLARGRLLAASEQAADEASLLVPDGPDVLADCLVKLGRRMTGRPRLGWVAAEGSGLRSGLARRVQRLLRLNEGAVWLPSTRNSSAAKLVAVLLLMVLTISCTLWAHPKASFAKGEDSMNVLRVSWRQSLAAAALTAFLGPLATDAPADDAPAPPKPAQLEDGSPVDQLLLAQRGEREREARGDRPRGERERDVEHREREARERGAERERGEQRERLAGEREELRRRAEELEREKAELREQGEGGIHELEEAVRGTQREREENARHIAELEEERAKLREKAGEEAEKRIDELSKEIERANDVRAELAERAKNLEREMAEHGENVARHMADLDRQFAETHEQLERIEAEYARGNPEREEIAGRIRELDRQIGELHGAGKHEEAERLEQEMRELHERLAGPRDRERPGPRGPREGMERLAQMEREIQELHEAGQHERAEQLERKLQELHRRLNAPREGDRPGPPPELEARLDHLRVAMDNLHAAGLHDQAEQIAQQIDRMIRERAPGPPDMRGPEAPPRGPRPEGPPNRRDPDARPRGPFPGGPPEGRGPDAGPRGPRPEGPPMPGGEIVDHLRGEIERLSGENNELRQMIKELREGQERLMNELRERK